MYGKIKLIVTIRAKEAIIFIARICYVSYVGSLAVVL